MQKVCKFLSLGPVKVKFIIIPACSLLLRGFLRRTTRSDQVPGKAAGISGSLAESVSDGPAAIVSKGLVVIGGLVRTVSHTCCCCREVGWHIGSVSIEAVLVILVRHISELGYFLGHLVPLKFG